MNKVSVWEKWLDTAIRELSALIPPGEQFILVDERQWGESGALPGRCAVPFLERGGQYWGRPADDATAIQEFERLRHAGASFMVFGWPAFWWLEHYTALRRHLLTRFPCAAANDRIIVYDLRKELENGRASSDDVEQQVRTTPFDRSRPNDPTEWERIYLGQIWPVTRLTHPVARAVADLTQPGDVLLEAGCGPASSSAELSTAGRVIELCDFSQAILDRAATAFRLSDLPPPRLTCCDLTQPLPWPDRSVDAVWSSGVLEHWTDDELIPIVREMARISRKCVIALVPYAGCLFYRLAKYMAEEADRWPYGREIPRQTMRRVFESAGLSNIREFTLCDECGPPLLGLTDIDLQRLIEGWWASLAPDDPVKEGQGYLLLTAGYVAETGDRRRLQRGPADP